MKTLFLLFVSLLSAVLVVSKGVGGRGGGGGGGRGVSGARGGVARGAVSSRSSFSGGVRSGTSGTKIGSSSISSSFGSSSFRSTAFHSSLYFHPPIIVGRPYVVAPGNPPIPYDNRTYHWTAESANRTFSGSKKDYMICQYDFGTDDGQLQNVTFANGTRATSLYFGCDQDSAFLNCCGMYCCENKNELYLMIAFLGLLLILACVAEFSKRRQEKERLRRGQQLPPEGIH